MSIKLENVVLASPEQMELVADNSASSEQLQPDT